MNTLVNTCIHGGSGMRMTWIDNMNICAIEAYLHYYNIQNIKDINPDNFIINMYKMLSTKYEFVITYEHLSKNSTSKYKDIVRPNVYVNGNFIFGFDWHNNKWHALQQTLIEFCNTYWHKLSLDDNYENIATTTDNSITGIFEKSLE